MVITGAPLFPIMSWYLYLEMWGTCDLIFIFILTVIVCDCRLICPKLHSPFLSFCGLAVMSAGVGSSRGRLLCQPWSHHYLFHYFIIIFRQNQWSIHNQNIRTSSISPKFLFLSLKLCLFIISNSSGSYALFLNNVSHDQID